ncbi:hypothetical protein OHS59_25855 [Streptomyces sp. NBC_00414]|uniref:hypothetical protein n=1 Tax=Streptomyces sp. NBC_00414 TaxID=2975739 RepID=UPI002E22E6A8
MSGSRWFRDTERNDIQNELTGWPAGPVFTPHKTGDQTARRAGRGFLTAIPVIANIVANIGGAVGSPFGGVSGRGEPEEPENEVQDFPVLWAAPGALARTVPWQLDPGRRPDGYSTDLVLTNRRLLFLGTRTGASDQAEVLGEFPLEYVAEARQMTFSEISADARITFADQSWIRLFTGNPTSAEKLAGILCGNLEALPESALTEAQKQRVSRFVSHLRGAAHPPVYIKLPSGIVLVEVPTRSKTGKGVFSTSTILMDASGEAAEPAPGDL